MRQSRSSRGAASPSPLGAEPLRMLLGEVFVPGTLAHLATRWGLSGSQVDLDALLAVLWDEEQNRDRISHLGGLEKAALEHLAMAGGRARAESLRRDLLLQGLGDTTAILRKLSADGLLFVLPNTSDQELDLESILAQETGLLQHDVALTTPLSDILLAELEPASVRSSQGLTGSQGVGASQGLTAFAGEVKPTTADSLETLEMNLLHLSSTVTRQGLKLNKSGAPHRRSLGRLAAGVVFPDRQVHGAGEVDLDDPAVLDYLAFLLALGREMGLTVLQDMEVMGDRAGQRAFFLGDRSLRHRLLIEGLQNLRTWSELESLALMGERASAPTEAQFSQRDPTGEGFIGARGYVLSVLRRANLKGWTPLDALIDLCDSLDRGYLRRTLEKTGRGGETRSFIEAVLRRTLTWAGVLSIGRSDDEMELARFTDRGQEALGQSGDKTVAALAAPCLIVQPNFEIMVFVDAAPLHLLYMLELIGERTQQADRVATYRLSSESVQRGLGMGEEVEAIIAALEEASHAPIPTSVLFELRDWERVHGNVTVHAPGYLIRQRDVEQFELHLGQLEHELGPEATVIRLDGRSAFVTTHRREVMDRFAARHRAEIFAYDDSPPVPCLHFVDPLTVMVDPLRCDIVTARSLERIAHRQDEIAEDGSLFYELDADCIRRRWPEAPLEASFAFLERRVDGGLPSEEALRLRALLDHPPRGRMITAVTILTVEEPDIARRLGEIDELQPMILETIGDRAFAIATKDQSSFEEVLIELGFILDSKDDSP